MEGSAEIGEERFGGAIRSQSLYGNGGCDGAHVEDDVGTVQRLESVASIHTPVRV